MRTAGTFVLTIHVFDAVASASLCHTPLVPAPMTNTVFVLPCGRLANTIGTAIMFVGPNAPPFRL